MEPVPVSMALLAGGLAVFNPCGFPVLSAFLAYNLGGDTAASRPAAQGEGERQRAGGRGPEGEGERQRAGGRGPQVAHGLSTGLLVTAGFLGVFAALGLPLSFGISAVSGAVPWIGLGFGAVLVLIGLATVAGRRIGWSITLPTRPESGRWITTQVLFGVGYGVASFACTLPVFLVLVGAATTGGATTTLVVFAGYGLGMATVLVALAMGAALAGGGLTQRARRVLPHMQLLSGVLLMISGGYLVYYWLRVGFSPRATVASDPLVGAVTGFAAWVETRATSGGGAWIVTVGALVAIAATASLASRRRTKMTRQGDDASSDSLSSPPAR